MRRSTKNNHEPITYYVWKPDIAKSIEDPRCIWVLAEEVEYIDVPTNEGAWYKVVRNGPPEYPLFLDDDEEDSDSNPLFDDAEYIPEDWE